MFVTENFLSRCVGNDCYLTNLLIEHSGLAYSKIMKICFDGT